MPGSQAEAVAEEGEEGLGKYRVWGWRPTWQNKQSLA